VGARSQSTAFNLLHFFRRDLGSGLIDYSQKMTTAAMHMADMNV
jgi:hypothetical protein